MVCKKTQKRTTHVEVGMQHNERTKIRGSLLEQQAIEQPKENMETHGTGKTGNRVRATAPICSCIYQRYVHAYFEQRMKRGIPVSQGG